MKIRWTVLIIACAIAVYMLTGVVMEIAYYTETVSSVNRTIMTAAEQAVSQVLASDELFSSDSAGSVYSNTSYSTIDIADGTANTYTKQNLFDAVYDTGGDKDLLYRRMYQHNAVFENADFMQNVCDNITTSIGGVTVPLIARMGLLEGGNSAGGMLQGAAYDVLKNAVDTGGYTASTAKFGGRDWMHLYEVQKEYTVSPKSAGTEHYYLAPTNVGMTYLDPNLLQTAFTANMDILMRAKFAKTNNLSAGTGIPHLLFGGSEAYVLSDDAADTVTTQNIINNGRFAYVKGKNITSSSGGGYTGGVNAEGNSLRPIISYKIVNVCDPANEKLIRRAVTEIAGNGTADEYTEWLNNQGIDTSEPHYCVVAKITFFADIIIPYSTELSRGLYSLYARGFVPDTASDFFQVHIDEGSLLAEGSHDFYSTPSMISGVTGNPYYTYTTYAAILP